MPRTSLTHPLRIDETPSGAGVIGMTLCPGKKASSLFGEAWDRDLALDLDAIAAWRADVVVTLMEADEFAPLGVRGLAEAMSERGLAWEHLPIRDVSVPDAAFERQWTVMGALLKARLRAGGRALLHCRGGLGRTGLVAARLLVETDGVSPEEAIRRVRRARAGAIETRQQEAYVRALRRPAGEAAFAEQALAALLGGAVGDAFGYGIEFDSWAGIVARFGPGGIVEPVFRASKLVVSDDTQMTLFTAEGMLRALGADPFADDAAIIASIRRAYLDWLKTQRGEPAAGARPGLLGHDALWAARAPGNTCMGALGAGGHGTPEAPINDSKGCGGVMRAAPLGMVRAWSADRAFDLAARAAALTHGHPAGWLSAGAMAGLIRDLLGGEGIAAAIGTMRARLAAHGRSGETLAAVDAAVALAGERRGGPRADHVSAIHGLGGGWVGEEALAIALYAALVAGSFREAVAIGANHGGDSDSTASIAGQIWGATHGLADLPADWVARLDVIEAIGETARGLETLGAALSFDLPGAA